MVIRKIISAEWVLESLKKIRDPLLEYLSSHKHFEYLNIHSNGYTRRIERFEINFAEFKYLDLRGWYQIDIPTKIN